MQSFEDLLNLPGIQVDSLEITDNEVIIKCSSFLDEQICPNCKKNCSRKPKYYVRTIKDLKIFGKQTILKLTIRQFKCEECHCYFNENFVFINPKFQMTERYYEYIYKCCQGLTLRMLQSKRFYLWML